MPGFVSQLLSIVEVRIGAVKRQLQGRFCETPGFNSAADTAALQQRKVMLRAALKGALCLKRLL